MGFLDELPPFPDIPPAQVAPARGKTPVTPATQVAPSASGRARTRKRLRTKLEDWMIPVAEQALLNGSPLRTVAGLIQVSYRTLERWLAAGEEEGCDDELLLDFVATVYEARSQVASKGMSIMNAHALTDWRAQLEINRAQDPETWAPQSRSKVDVDVKVSERKRDLSHLSLEQLEELNRLESEAEAIKLGLKKPAILVASTEG